MYQTFAIMGENKITKIMIADDNLHWSKVLEEYLEKNMNDVQIVANVDDGDKEIEMAKELNPDIIITDILRENGISGLEAIKRCKELNLNEIKFIVETANFNMEERYLLQEMGITNILIKPFDMERLIEIIEKIR